MALGLALSFAKLVDLAMVVVPGLVNQGYLCPNLGLGLPCVLLPDAVVLGHVFL